MVSTDPARAEFAVGTDFVCLAKEARYLVEQEAPSFFNPTLPHIGGVQWELFIDLNPG